MYLWYYIIQINIFMYFIYFIGITTSNVSIIGQRVNYGFGCGDFEDDRPHDISPSVLKIQNKEHPRHYKHTKG